MSEHYHPTIADALRALRALGAEGGDLGEVLDDHLRHLAEGAAIVGGLEVLTEPSLGYSDAEVVRWVRSVDRQTLMDIASLLRLCKVHGELP